MQVAIDHVESPFLRHLPYLDGESHPGNRGCSQLHMSPVRIMPKGKSKVTAGTLVQSWEDRKFDAIEEEQQEREPTKDW